MGRAELRRREDYLGWFVDILPFHFHFCSSVVVLFAERWVGRELRIYVEARCRLGAASISRRLTKGRRRRPQLDRKLKLRDTVMREGAHGPTNAPPPFEFTCKAGHFRSRQDEEGGRRDGVGCRCRRGRGLQDGREGAEEHSRKQRSQSRDCSYCLTTN